MKVKRIGLALLLALAALALFQGTRKGGPELFVTGGEPITYVCDSGERVVARYYDLSDGSLHFVKLLFPDGRTYTLPQVLSASGARYTDEAELVWWTKGDEAHVERRDDEGQWQAPYESCRVEP